MTFRTLESSLTGLTFSEDKRIIHDSTASEIIKHIEYSNKNIETVSRIYQKEIQYIDCPGPKLLIGSLTAYSHFVLDFLPKVLLWHRVNPDGKVFYYTTSKKNSNESNKNFADIFLKKLQEYGIDIEFISDAESIKVMDNFYFFSKEQVQQDTWGLNFFLVKELTNFINFLNKNSEVKPTKKIYVSRQKTKPRDLEKNNEAISKGSLIKDDTRIFNEDALEIFFMSIGYDIVYPEDFESIIDQAQTFWNAKVVAGVSGGGLTNIALMQDGQTMIEIDVPIVVAARTSFHMLYKTLASLKGHFFLGIPSYDHSRNGEKVVDLIKNNKQLYEYLKNI